MRVLAQQFKHFFPRNSAPMFALFRVNKCLNCCAKTSKMNYLTVYLFGILKKPMKKPVKNAVIGVNGTKNCFTEHRKNNFTLLQKNFRDAVKDHCHITGRYRGAAHNACNLKMRIKPKTDQIPVVFHNLRGYDAHHLMQAMSQLQKEVKCVANNIEKYITFSVGGLRFIDSLDFLQGSLDSLVSATPKESLKIASTISKGSDLLYKKGIYPYKYMGVGVRTRMLDGAVHPDEYRIQEKSKE